MGTSSVTVQGVVQSILTGSKTIGPITVSSTAAAPQTTQVVLASGFNSITVPAGSSGCVIVFAAASTATKTLKGPTGDTGIRLAKTGLGAVLVWDSTSLPSTIGITTDGADTGNTTEIAFF